MWKWFNLDFCNARRPELRLRLLKFSLHHSSRLLGGTVSSPVPQYVFIVLIQLPSRSDTASDGLSTRPRASLRDQEREVRVIQSVCVTIRQEHDYKMRIIGSSSLRKEAVHSSFHLKTSKPLPKLINEFSQQSWEFISTRHMCYRGRAELPGPHCTLRMPWGLVVGLPRICPTTPARWDLSHHHSSQEQGNWGSRDWYQPRRPDTSQGMRQLLGLMLFPPSVRTLQASSCGFSPHAKYVSEVGNCPWIWVTITQRHFVFWGTPLVGISTTTQTIVSFKLYPVVFQVRVLIELFT